MILVVCGSVVLLCETLKISLHSASLEIENVRKASESEIAALRAQLKKAEMKIETLDKSLEQKVSKKAVMTDLLPSVIGKLCRGGLDCRLIEPILSYGSWCYSGRWSYCRGRVVTIDFQGDSILSSASGIKGSILTEVGDFFRAFYVLSHVILPARKTPFYADGKGVLGEIPRILPSGDSKYCFVTHKYRRLIPCFKIIVLDRLVRPYKLG